MGFHHLLLKGGVMYDPVVKIPLIVKYPGAVTRIGRISSLTSTIDLPAMILRECGADAPKSMQTRSRDGYVFAEFFGGTKDYMIRSETHKLLIEGSLRSTRLFDMRNDPLELHDISGESENRELIETMKGRLMEEFLFTPMRAHLDLNAPAVHGCQGESPDEMMQYMRERSPVKPDR